MVTIVAISVGFTYVVVTGTSDSAINQVATGSLMTGNVQVRLMDEGGNIKAFRQTDNHITITGMEILASQLFNDTRTKNVNQAFPDRGGILYGTTGAWENFTDNDIATGAPGINTGGAVKYMNIGNGTGDLVYGDRQLSAQIDDSSVRVADGGCDRIIAAISNATDTSIPIGVNNTFGFDTADQVTGGANLAQINITAVATFDGADCYATIIHEAGIWTDSNETFTAGGPGIVDSGWMFARNTFGNVDLTENDSLELTWTFTFTDS